MQNLKSYRIVYILLYYIFFYHLYNLTNFEIIVIFLLIDILVEIDINNELK